VRTTIVCGVDGSGGAREAVRVAAHLAQRLRSRLVLVHVHDAQLRDGIDEQDLLGVAMAEEHCAAVEVQVRSGLPGEQLAEVAEDEQAEIVVVGSRGSVFRDLVDLAPCPVLIVPRARGVSNG
jgi:nucleotide-binding universal stress UspA family protein